MTRDDIIKLAREHGASPYTNRHYPDLTYTTFSPSQLEALFHAAQRQQAAEIERLTAELGDLPEAVNMLLTDCKRKDGLLREASENLQTRLRMFDNIKADDDQYEDPEEWELRPLIANIKTELGEQP